jgi:hypothetical protein
VASYTVSVEVFRVYKLVVEAESASDAEQQVSGMQTTEIAREGEVENVQVGFIWCEEAEC